MPLGHEREYCFKAAHASSDLPTEVELSMGLAFDLELESWCLDLERGPEGFRQCVMIDFCPKVFLFGYERLDTRADFEFERWSTETY